MGWLRSVGSIKSAMCLLHRGPRLNIYSVQKLFIYNGQDIPCTHTPPPAPPSPKHRTPPHTHSTHLTHRAYVALHTCTHPRTNPRTCSLPRTLRTHSNFLCHVPPTAWTHAHTHPLPNTLYPPNAQSLCYTAHTHTPPHISTHK